MTPEERSLRARIAAYSLHAQRGSRELTAPALKAFLDRFEKQVDPEGVPPPQERARRAEAAKKAYMSAVALKSAEARRKRKTESGS